MKYIAVILLTIVVWSFVIVDICDKIEDLSVTSSLDAEHGTKTEDTGDPIAEDTSTEFASEDDAGEVVDITGAPESMTEDVVSKELSVDMSAGELAEESEEITGSVDVDVVIYESPEEYIRDIAAALKRSATPNGLLCSVACAMAYTEGGAGRSGVYTKTNNCFGIKATPTWEGLVYSRVQGEIYISYKEARSHGSSADLFRVYVDIESSVKDYISLISGDYYCEALSATTTEEYISILLGKGYGSPYMKNVWTQIIRRFNLERYDTCG